MRVVCNIVKGAFLGSGVASALDPRGMIFLRMCARMKFSVRLTNEK